MSILVGLFLGVMIILILRVAALAYFPFPEGLQWLKPQDMAIYFKELPDSAFVMIIVSHILGAFLASLIASLISKSARFSTGIITGAIIFIFVVFVNFMFEFPTLYLVADTILTTLAAFGGATVGNKRVVR